MNSANANGKGLTPNGQTKKTLVIKPLKLKPKLRENFEDETWAKLEDAVNAVHAKRPVSYGLEQLYRAVEDMCIHKMQERLYQRLSAAVDAHLAQQLQQLQSYLGLDPVSFLDKVYVMWEDYCSQMLTIRSIFLVLDRTYVIGLPGMRSLVDTGLQLLRKHLEQHKRVEVHVVDGLLALVERERNGESINRQLLSGLVRMLNDLGLYTLSFQGRFLEASSSYYQAEGEEMLLQMDLPQYLLHCESRLQQEHDRCLHCLEPSTRKPLIMAVEQQLLARHVSTLLDKGFQQLMTGHRLGDLGRLHSLLARVNALDQLKAAWRDYISDKVVKIVKDEMNDKDMVDKLLHEKKQLDEVLGTAFHGQDSFSSSLRDAFQASINMRQNKPAELVAKFIDSKLRAGGSKGLTDMELEAALDQALVLFRFIQGKDIFEAFYKKDLAKRLLLGRSASIDAEKLMIAKLKSECGNQFTQNIEGMFRDMEVARDTSSVNGSGPAAAAAAGPSSRGLSPSGPDDGAGPGPTSRAAAAAAVASVSGRGAGVDFHPVVLTQQFWPSQTPLDLNLPEELQQLQQAFTERYLRQWKEGRKLVWQHAMATCVVKAHFKKGVKELSVSLLQAVVLMLFNTADSLSYADMKQQLGVKDEGEKELKRTLLSLSVGKVRVLLKSPKSPEVGEDDTFSYNADFSNPLYRIRINNIQMKETTEENVKTNEQVLQDRQHQIDACIVRIMKTRKTLSHKLLTQEVLTQLKFQLTQKDLKKRIDNLIEREFLERSTEDASVYHYLA